MLKQSRFKELAKALNDEEYLKTVNGIERLILENKKYCDKNNYGYLCNLFSSLPLTWMYIDEGKSKEESQKIVLDAMYKFLEPSIPSMKRLAKHKWFVPYFKKGNAN